MAGMHLRIASAVKKHFRATDIAISNTGGAKKWECILCKKPITGSATKLKAQLLGRSGFGVGPCPEINEDIQRAILALEQEYPANAGLEPASSSLGQSIASSSSSRQPGIADVIKRLNKGEVDQAVALWFYINGIPFNTVRCDSTRSYSIVSWLLRVPVF